MARLFFSLLLTLFGWMSVRAQPCERIDIQDKKQQKVLKRFIQECEKKGFLTPDSGMIHLTEWVDKQGETNWQVWPQTSWQQYPWIAPFLDHCTDCRTPVGWTKLGNRLILRYHYDQPRDTLTKAESSCLKNLLISSVTILPPLSPPPKEVPIVDYQGRQILDKDGKPRTRKYFPNLSSGGGGNNTHITFKKDGSIQKGLSL